MRVIQIKLLLSSASTIASTGTGQSTSTPQDASVVQTLFDLFIQYIADLGGASVFK